MENLEHRFLEWLAGGVPTVRQKGAGQICLSGPDAKKGGNQVDISTKSNTAGGSIQ